MTADERNALRGTFDEIPELYDRARPRYPDRLFHDLVALAELSHGARLLEIGCGTGQATIPLAERGFEIVCVELGAGLAALARRTLASFPGIDVVNATFESWEADGTFDVVVAFTAFHWIDPDVRYAKPASLLRPAGSLAVVTTQHVLPEDGDPFFAEVQEDYDAVVPSDDNRPPPRPDEVGDLSVEFETSGHFAETVVRRYIWDVDYSAAAYIDLLETFSGHRGVWDEDTRRRLYDRITRRIAARPNGTVRRTSMALLHVARRL